MRNGSSSSWLIHTFKKAGCSNQASDELVCGARDLAPVGTRPHWPHCHIPAADLSAMRRVARAMLPELFGGQYGLLVRGQDFPPELRM